MRAAFGAGMAMPEELGPTYERRRMIDRLLAIADGASAVAAGMHSLLLGDGPLFAVPHHAFSGLGQLPYFVLLGLALLVGVLGIGLLDLRRQAMVENLFVAMAA